MFVREHTEMEERVHRHSRLQRRTHVTPGALIERCETSGIVWHVEAILPRTRLCKMGTEELTQSSWSTLVIDTTITTTESQLT